MSDDEYLRTQSVLVAMVVAARGLDLETFLARLDRAEAVGPILDPTLYRRAQGAAAAVRRAAVAALALQRCVAAPPEAAPPCEACDLADA